MNREQRRQSHKYDRRFTVEAITVSFTDGSSVDLDTTKVMIIDKDTKAQLFKTVIDQESYTWKKTE